MALIAAVTASNWHLTPLSTPCCSRQLVKQKHNCHLAQRCAAKTECFVHQLTDNSGLCSSEPSQLESLPSLPHGVQPNTQFTEPAGRMGQVLHRALHPPPPLPIRRHMLPCALTPACSAWWKQLRTNHSNSFAIIRTSKTSSQSPQVGLEE